MLPRFDPVKALEIIERDRVTIFMGVPTMYGALLNAPSASDADTSSLRLCVSGGASLPVELMRAFEAHFGCTILEGYGLSETSPVASFNLPDARKPGSIGTPIPGVEMRVVDDDGNPVADGEVGEIVIRGHNIMKGYWNRPEATAEAIDGDGWFHSGDMAQDRRGRLLLHRRPQEGPDHPRRLQRLSRARSRRSSTSTRPSPRPPSSASRTTSSARRSPRSSRSSRARKRRPTSCRHTARTRSRRTSTRATCGSSTSSRRGRPARSSNASFRRPPEPARLSSRGDRALTRRDPASPVPSACARASCRR